MTTERASRSLRLALAATALLSASPALAGFSYDSITVPILSAKFKADFAELTAERMIGSTNVNMAMLIDPRDGAMLDITDELFGPGAGPASIALGLTKTGVFEAEIDPSFFPALMTGNVGLWALFTDTADGRFGIDFLSLEIETEVDIIEVFFQGMGNDGFKISPNAPADGADLSASFQSLRPFGATGTGFDETISSKAIHVLPAPGSGILLAMGGLAMTRRKRRNLGVALVAGAAAALPALAHQGHGPVDYAQMTRRAAVIAQGEVESVNSFWDAGQTRIFTTIRVRVDTYFKAAEQPQVLEFTQLGGSVGDMTLSIIGSPAYVQGEAVLVMLHDNYQARLQPVVQMEHGLLRIEVAPDGELYYVGPDGVAESESEFIGRIRQVNRAEQALPEQTIETPRVDPNES